MKERGILFSTPMVKAILYGRKTMTRRKIDVDPGSIIFKTKIVPFTFIEPDQQDEDLENVMVIAFAESPYGNVGDILWVRETWHHGCMGGYIYKAGRTEEEVKEYKGAGYKWKPSRFMPKKAARIWLEIDHVRVEKLHDITYGDAILEGCGKLGTDYPQGNFFDVWKNINGVDSLNSNPWVWVISFKVLSTTGRPEGLNQPVKAAAI